MTMELEQIKRRLSILEGGLHVFSDRVVFDKDIELQRGRHTTAVYAGRVDSGAAGTPFPTGWTVTKNATGNYTVTHNLNRTDYAVLLTFIGAASTAAGGACSVSSATATTFTIDISGTSFAFDHSIYFAVLI